MTIDPVLCFGLFCENENLPIEKRRLYKIKDKVFTDKKINKYIAFAIEYAKGSSSDIFIYEKETILELCLYMKQGLFSGINKKAFEYLLKNADDCIISKLEDDENVSLEIKLIINVPQEKC